MFCVLELDANVPLSKFGQDTLERLSVGNLELLPVASSQSQATQSISSHARQSVPNQPKQPVPDQPKQPISNWPRQPIPNQASQSTSSQPKMPAPNQQRQLTLNQLRQPIPIQPKQPIPNQPRPCVLSQPRLIPNQPNRQSPSTSKVIQVAPCQLESGKLIKNQASKNPKIQTASVTESQKMTTTGSQKMTTGSQKMTTNGSQKMKQTGSQKVSDPSILNKVQEKIIKSKTVSSIVVGNEQKEKLASTAHIAKKGHIPSAKRSRFEDRLERLSQNFDSSPEESSAPSKPAAINSARNETESPEKQFLMNAKRFGAKLSSLIKNRSRSPVGGGGCDGMSGSDTDMNSESQSHGKKGKSTRASLSLSRKGTPQKSSPMKRSWEIKSEPEEDGYPGRRKKSKLCRW